MKNPRCITHVGLASLAQLQSIVNNNIANFPIFASMYVTLEIVYLLATDILNEVVHTY